MINFLVPSSLIGLGSYAKVSNEETIKTRGQHLSETAVKVWRAPQLQKDVLETYRSKVTRLSTYTIDDHPYLSNGSEMYGKTVKELFDALRKKFLEIDPCVSEEFLKRYVAYKAETNFVDVIPQAKRLLLSLNMPFADITDPRGLCKNVTGLGRWGNGNVEVSFNSLEELPHIMGLVRQAFERQMGNGGEQ